MSEIIKKVFGFFSGMIMKIDDFRLQKVSASIAVSYRALCRLANSFCNTSVFFFLRVIEKADRFLISICLAYLIFTFREFKSCHKGKTAILHLCFGTEKNRRLGSKKTRYIRAFRRRHLFVSTLWYPRGDSNPCYRRERAAS